MVATAVAEKDEVQVSGGEFLPELHCYLRIALLGIV